MNKGVVYLVWGHADAQARSVLPRAIESLQRTNPYLEHTVVDLGASATLLDKAKMLEYSPYDLTCFLDTDTVVLGALDYGFSQAFLHGIACSICECPHAIRYPSCPVDQPDTIEYNTGVLFFDKQRMRPLFEQWYSLNTQIDSSITWDGVRGTKLRMAENDQAGFAFAMTSMGINPFVLPLNWNFRPRWHKTWFGNLRIWHDYTDPSPLLTTVSRGPMEFSGIAGHL